MKKPNTLPDDDLERLEQIDFTQPVIEGAKFVADQNYIASRERCVRRMRVDNQLRGYLRVFGIVVLPLIAFSQALSGRGGLFWIVVPLVAFLYLVFGVRIKEWFQVWWFRQSGLLDAQMTCEFYREGILQTIKDEGSFAFEEDLKIAGLFPEGLLLVTKLDSPLLIPRLSADNFDEIVKRIRAIVPFDERYQ